MLRKVVFSSCKAALAAKNKVNYCGGIPFDPSTFIPGPTHLEVPNRVRVSLMSLNRLIKIIYQKHVVALHLSWHKILFKYAKAFLKG